MEEMLLCQTCLVTGVHIHPMSAEDMETYRLFVTKLEDPLDVMYVCGQCKGIMKKINKFIKQCRLAEQVLQDYNSNSKRLHFSDTCRLSTSETVCHYIGPEADKKSKSDDKISQGDGKLFQGNDKMSQGDDKMSQSDDKVSQGDDKMSQGDDKIFEGDDKISEGDDDTPLVMLILNNDDYDLNNYDNHAELDNLDTSIDNIKQETNTQTDTIKRRQKKFRRKKKEAGKGFSSRMVMETAEYKVIKLTKEEIIEEMRLHSESDKYKLLPYKCEQCVRGFNFDDVLQSHMQKHSPKNGHFQCEICAQYCASRVSLRGHMKSHSTRYKCKLCGLVRLSRQHILEHHSLQHTGSPALYSCPQCDHTTHKRTAMQRHVRLHSASEPLKCHYCGKYYKTKESLRIHIMRHDDKKLHQCEVCTSSFVYAAQLTKHMRSVHVLKDYYCVECDIMFKSMDNLKQHLQRAKRHRDDSSYKFQCGQCSERFVSASTLATHRTNAHGAARSEACALCPRAYSSPEALRWHTRRAHTARDNCKLPCPLCEREFSRKYVLRVHMRTHTGERPHACECGAGFAQPAALRAHRAAHHKKPAVTSEIET